MILNNTNKINQNTYLILQFSIYHIGYPTIYKILNTRKFVYEN